MMSKFSKNPEGRPKAAQGAPKGYHRCPKMTKVTPKDGYGQQDKPEGKHGGRRWSAAGVFNNTCVTSCGHAGSHGKLVKSQM